MKRLLASLCFSAALVLCGCGGGSSSSPANISGNWNATLMSSGNSSPVLSFTTSFAQSNGSSLNVTRFNFTTSSPCFVSDETESAGFTLAGNFNGDVTGAFQLAVQSGSPSGNTLTLQGSVNNATISGTWVLSGVTSGCTGSGSFTMTKM